MTDLLVRNLEESKEEILIGYDKDSFYESWQENETWEVSFTIQRTNFNGISFDLIDYENILIWNGQRFVIKQMASYASGSKIYKDVTATHIYYTIQDCRQYDGSLTGNLAINQVLSHIFKSGNNGFTWEVIDPIGVFSKVEQENFGNGNYLDLINEVIDDYKCVVIPDTFALKTQIRGFGKTDDKDNYIFSPITYTSPLAEKYGIRVQDPVEDQRYTIPGNMSARLKQEIHDFPDISGSISLKWVIELEKGDRVPFIYEPLNINSLIRVVGITHYPALPNKPPEITLSNTKKTMTSILANLARKGVI